MLRPAPAQPCRRPPGPGRSAASTRCSATGSGRQAGGDRECPVPEVDLCKYSWGMKPSPSSPAEPVAGVLAGLVAGAAYLLAQMGFAATVQGGVGWEPLHRISAMLLGEGALPPPADIDLTIGGFGLLIHFALAINFGRVVDLLVRDRDLPAACLRGAAVGLALYALNFWVIAPALFPWFENNRGLTTLADHLLFGAVAGAAYVQLRAWLQMRRAAAPQNA